MVLCVFSAAQALAATPSLSAGAGGMHSAALKADGSVWFWGYNFTYVGGRTITYNSISTPTNYASLYPSVAGSVALAGGINAAMAVQANGNVMGWGSDTAQLWGATAYPVTTPTQIASGFATVSVGYDHVLALKSDNTLWAWGKNASGQLGDNTVIQRTAPVQIGSGFAAIAAGSQFSVALKQDGTLWAWGNDNNGQVGDNTPVGTITFRNAPVQIGTGFVSIAAGSYHTLALKADGSLWAWGYNANGQLGDGTTTTRIVPVQIAASGYAKIAGGENHSVAIKQDGTLMAWGSNALGQLGDGTTISRLTPTQIGTGYSLIAAGYAHTLAAKTDGSLLAWGDNSRNQLGDGTKVASLLPKVIDAAFFPVDNVAPTVPTLTVTGRSTTSVSLGLSGATDAAGVTSYKIYRNGTLFATQPQASVTDSGLAAGTSYSYTASACDAAGNCSAQSSAVSATTISLNAVPTAPTVGTSNLAMTSVTLTFTGATDDVGVTGYKVYRDGTLIDSPATNTYTDTGLVVNTNYSYTASACDVDANCSPLSAAVVVTTPDTAAPTTPNVLNLYPSATAVHACWGTSTDNVKVVSYQLTRGGTLINTNTNMSVSCFDDTGLTAATTYGYQVAACDAAGNCSAPTVVVSTKTLSAPDTQAPSVPTGLRAVAANVIAASPFPVVIVSGAIATDNIAVTAYRIYRDGLKVADSNHYFDTAVQAGKSYSYTVDACDALNNCSAQSAAVSVTTPGAPTITPVTPPAAGTTISYAWQAVKQGWYLLGNSLNSSIDVRASFSDVNSFNTVWKWDPSLARWAFYSPVLDAAGGTALADYASSHGYAMLDTIYPGEGFWVNAKTATTQLTRSGTAFALTGDQLLPGWSLAASGADVSAPNLVAALGDVTTFWAWDDVSAQWYFYAPQLATNNTLASYNASHNYLDFGSLGMGNGRGFWINHALTNPASPVALPPAAPGKPVWSSEVSNLGSVYVVNSGGEVLGAGAAVVSPANTRETTLASNGYLTIESTQQARQFVADEGAGGGPGELLLLKRDGTLLARGFNNPDSLTPVNFSGSLGTGTASGVEVPNWTTVLTNVRAINRTTSGSVGSGRAFALGNDDSLWVTPHEVNGARVFTKVASNVHSYKTSSGGEMVLTRDGQLLVGGTFFHLPVPTDTTARAGMELTNNSGASYTYFQSRKNATGYSRENMVVFATDVVGFDYFDLGGDNGYFCYVTSNGDLYSNLDPATMQYAGSQAQIVKWTDIGSAKTCAVASGPSMAVLQRNGTVRFTYALNSGLASSGWKEAATNVQSFSFGGTTNVPDVGAIANPIEAVITAIKTDGSLWTNNEHFTGLALFRTNSIRQALSDVAGFEGHYAWKTDGTLWRLTTSTLQANTGSYVQVPNVLVQP